MAKGKTINVFLIDGDPSLRIKCTLQNWIGVAYRIPRAMLDDCKEGNSDIVKHLKQAGIYFLLGQEPISGNKTIYIGQAVSRKHGDGLLCRLLEHKRNQKEKYWADWNEAVIFTTQNNSFGPTEISYLENKFTNLARQCGRYNVKNGNDPNQGNFTEEKESELIEYIELAKTIIGILGHITFEPLIKKQNIKHLSSNITDKEPCVSEGLNNYSNYSKILFTSTSKFNASAVLTNKGFILLKNSKISQELYDSAPTITVKTREKYKSIINNFVTTKDIMFSSSSAAATFVTGFSTNGNKFWKTKDGKCPKDFNLQ